MGSYKDSAAYRRSSRLRPDGSPVWPLTDADNPRVANPQPSAPEAGDRPTYQVRS